MTWKMSTYFSRLEIAGWRQFGVIDLDLSSPVTILTGVNASGKTTILSLLSRHFQWQPSFLGVPFMSKSGIRFLPGFSRGKKSRYAPEESTQIGRLSYEDGGAAKLVVYKSESIDLAVAFDTHIDLNGLYISSHRSSSPYQKVEAIPAEFGGAPLLLDAYVNIFRQRNPRLRNLNLNPMLQMKSALLSAAMFGEGNSSVRPNRGALDIWEGFQACLRELMPRDLGFERLLAVPPEIVVQTRSGEFAIDAASGGLNAILEMGWQIFLQSKNHANFTVLIDEPENHLHPSLQRDLLPSLIRAFPGARFLVATHSPFVVTSSPVARVHVLDYVHSSVHSSQLDFVNKSASAEQTLRDVLGLETTLPIWAEDEFNRIIGKYISQNMLNPSDLLNLRAELRESGLNGILPRAVTEFTEARRDALDGDGR